MNSMTPLKSKEKMGLKELAHKHDCLFVLYYRLGSWLFIDSLEDKEFATVYQEVEQFMSSPRAKAYRDKREGRQA